MAQFGLRRRAHHPTGPSIRSPDKECRSDSAGAELTMLDGLVTPEPGHANRELMRAARLYPW